MDYKGMFIKYEMGIGVSRLPFYFVDGIEGKFKTEALAKRAITMHLKKFEDIEVVPRTQQEIDDYGPNGIQPPNNKKIKEILGDAQDLINNSETWSRPIVNNGNPYLAALVSMFKPVMKVAESRNQREGRYAGRYAASDNNFKRSHHRQGLQMIGSVRAFWSLKEYGRYRRQNGL